MPRKIFFSLLLVGLPTLFLVPPGAVPQDPPRSEVDIDDFIAELQEPVRGKDYAGIVWWIPVEFWENAARQEGTPEEAIAQQVAPLRDYTMFAIAVGKIGPFGGITFVPADQIRAN
ncbi:hypothetical protein MYX77_10180, partial [Acidobacteriia bacterium AH_259_A11_L15]|nr:hypothetical protein [Acidobacteriia bacterium AH_259_A11_L15]